MNASADPLDTVRAWASQRGAPCGLTPDGKVVVALDPDGSRDEMLVFRTRGTVPLVCTQYRTSSAIAAERRDEVVASLNSWNTMRRLPRAWSAPRGDGTLVVALEAALLASLATADALERLLDAVADGAAAFWHWADTTRTW